MADEMPDEFKVLCAMFHQDVLRNFVTWEGVIAPAINTLDRAEMRVAKDYLDKILGGGYSVDQLTALWESTSTQIAIFDGSDKSAKEAGIVYFLKLMRSMIEQRLAGAGGA